MPRIIVTAKPEALGRALVKTGTTIPEIVTAVQGHMSRATVWATFTRTGYPIGKDKAQAIADALGLPIGALFQHLDGAALP